MVRIAGAGCSLAVGPGVEVAAELVARRRALRRCAWWRRRSGSTPVRSSADGGWDRPVPVEHPLLAHAVADVLAMAPMPDDVGVVVTISPPCRRARRSARRPRWWWRCSPPSTPWWRPMGPAGIGW
ncbi:MAG: hypothetical protein R2746_16990 [Acidimicrobiales bacterium]